jgi:UDP-N-acetylglucosamine--N-acetylmuramyl-(pentapeptide) pyrophosphoryl-undecaprenol N-acetylglucosamine transferase
MSTLRVIIAGGGTGGHIFPAVAVGHALQRLQPGTELLFVGAKGKMEMEKVPQEGFRIEGLDIVGFNRTNLLKNIWLPIKLLKSRMHAKSIINEFKPNVIVGVGGYASFPVLHAGQGMGIPTLIQEQNSYAGKSNKILGKHAKAICVAYEDMQKFFPADKLILTGNPVRKAISDMSVSGKQGKEFFGLDESRKTILVIGGSLGAKSINESIDSMLDDLVKEGVQVIWQCGKPYHEQAKSRAAAYGSSVKVFDFIREMNYAYAAANIVVSRAGALAIAELCIAAKPVIFVPYPYAAENHQESNARALVERNAAMMVRDNEAMTELGKKLKVLLHDTDMQEIMTQHLKELAIRDADERIAKKVIELAAGK